MFRFPLRYSTNSDKPPLCSNFFFLSTLWSTRIIFKPALRKERSLNFAAKISKSKTTLVNVSVEGVSLISVPVVSLFPVALSLALGTPSE